jgi:hypothetical protein
MDLWQPQDGVDFLRTWELKPVICPDGGGDVRLRVGNRCVIIDLRRKQWDKRYTGNTTTKPFPEVGGGHLSEEDGRAGRESPLRYWRP